MSQTQSHLKKSFNAAIGGGIPGMFAMAVQVLSLMWLRTTVNYQYRHGTKMIQSFKILYKQGGIRRFYRGVGPALLQAPLSRFGDTAANNGILTLLDSYETTKSFPIGIKTIFASITAGLIRILLMPIDTLKTSLQVSGKDALNLLKEKYSKNGVKIFYNGSIAISVATFVGHYPWFFTYNYLNKTLKVYPKQQKLKNVSRSAFIGFCSSIISDSISNSFRVIKTTRQTLLVQVPYITIIKMIIEKDGILGLMGRGLKTKILTNGLQGLMFSVLWKLFQDIYKKNKRQFS